MVMLSIIVLNEYHTHVTCLYGILTSKIVLEWHFDICYMKHVQKYVITMTHVQNHGISMVHVQKCGKL